MAGLETEDHVMDGRIFKPAHGTSHPLEGVPNKWRAIEIPYTQKERKAAALQITRVEATTSKPGPIRKGQEAGYLCSWPHCQKCTAARSKFTRHNDAERHICEQMFAKKVSCPADGCGHQSKQKEHMTTHINAKHLAELGLATQYHCRGCWNHWLDASPRNKHEKKCELYLIKKHNGSIAPKPTRRTSTTTRSSTETDATMSNTEADVPTSSTEADVTMGNTEADMTMNNVSSYSQPGSPMMDIIDDCSTDLRMSDLDNLYSGVTMSDVDNLYSDVMMDDIIDNLYSNMMLNNNTDTFSPNPLMTNNFSTLDTDLAMTPLGLDPDNLTPENSVMLSDICMGNSSDSEASMMMNNDNDNDTDMPSLYIDPALLQNCDLAHYTLQTLEELNGQEEGAAGCDGSFFSQFCNFDDDTQMVV